MTAADILAQLRDELSEADTLLTARLAAAKEDGDDYTRGYLTGKRDGVRLALKPVVAAVQQIGGES